MLEEHTCYKIDKLIETGEVVVGKKEDGGIFINFPSNNERGICYYFYDEESRGYIFDASTFLDEGFKGVDITDYLVEKLNISYKDADEIEEYFINLA